MALNIETEFMSALTLAHTAELDLSAVMPAHISIADAVVGDVGGVQKFTGNVVSVSGSPIKFTADAQLWNAAMLSSILMDTTVIELDPTAFTAGTGDAYTETTNLVLRLDTLTGVVADDLAAIKAQLTLLTEYDFAAVGEIATGDATPGLVVVDAVDGSVEFDLLALNAADFDHVYAVTLGGRLFDGETVYVCGGNGTVELLGADLGDIVTKQIV